MRVVLTEKFSAVESVAEVQCATYSADGGAVWLEWLDKPDKNPSVQF